MLPAQRRWSGFRLLPTLHCSFLALPVTANSITQPAVVAEISRKRLHQACHRSGQETAVEREQPSLRPFQDLPPPASPAGRDTSHWSRAQGKWPLRRRQAASFLQWLRVLWCFHMQASGRRQQKVACWQTLKPSLR